MTVDPARWAKARRAAGRLAQELCGFGWFGGIGIESEPELHLSVRVTAPATVEQARADCDGLVYDPPVLPLEFVQQAPIVMLAAAARTAVVRVMCAGDLRPPRGAPIVVRVLDSSAADAASVALAEAHGIVGGGPLLDEVSITFVPIDHRTPTIWALVDVDRDGRVGAGDLITVESFPLPDGDGTIAVTVRPVRP